MAAPPAAQHTQHCFMPIQPDFDESTAETIPLTRQSPLIESFSSPTDEPVSSDSTYKRKPSSGKRGIVYHATPSPKPTSSPTSIQIDGTGAASKQPHPLPQQHLGFPSMDELAAQLGGISFGSLLSLLQQPPSTTVKTVMEREPPVYDLSQPDVPLIPTPLRVSMKRTSKQMLMSLFLSYTSYQPGESITEYMDTATHPTDGLITQPIHSPPYGGRRVKYPSTTPRVNLLDDTLLSTARRVNTTPHSGFDLQDQPIQYIHRGFMGLFNGMSILILTNCGLRQLPDAISLLINVEEFACNDNELTTLPWTICFMRKLRRIYAQYNKLSSLPIELGRLPELQSLCIGHNQLTSIPESLYSLDTLTNLSLSFNYISYISPSIADMKKLNTLWLDHNPLPESGLPSTVQLIDSLRIINARNTLLTTIPTWYHNFNITFFIGNDLTKFTLPPKAEAIPAGGRRARSKVL